MCQISGRIKQTGLSAVISQLGSPLNNNSPFLRGNTESSGFSFSVRVCLRLSWMQHSTPLHLANKSLCQKIKREEKLHFTFTTVASPIKSGDKTIEAAEDRKTTERETFRVTGCDSSCSSAGFQFCF